MAQPLRADECKNLLGDCTNRLEMTNEKFLEAQRLIETQRQQALVNENVIKKFKEDNKKDMVIVGAVAISAGFVIGIVIGLVAGTR